MSPYVVVAGVVLAGLLLFVYALGMGVDPVGQGWAQTNVRYFLYAFLYVIFAVDAVYLFPWATVIRQSGLGRASLAEMGIFVGVLLIGLAHAARRGLLRWV